MKKMEKNIIKSVHFIRFGKNDERNGVNVNNKEICEKLELMLNYCDIIFYNW